MNRRAKTLLLSASLAVSCPVLSQTVEEALKEFARAEYPDDYAMQEHVFGRQLEAYAYMQAVTEPEIRKIAIEEYPTDYAMQKHVYDKQLAASRYMASVTSWSAPT